MITAMLDNKYEVYADAIRDLAAYDQDYGRDQNAVGFSRFDTGIGHSLASIPFEQWSPAQLVQAHKVLSRYKNTQLPGLGYAWADMPDVSNVSVVRDAGTKTAGFAEIDIENGAFLFRWGGADPHFSSRVEDARGLPGARYDKNTKAWSVPITMNSIDAVSDVLAKYAKTELPFCESSDFHDGINDAITAVTAKLEASSAKSVSRETLRLHRVTNPDIVRPFQLAGIKWCVENKQTILSDDMGCISGDAKVSVSRGGGTRIRTMRQLYEGFNGLSKNKWRDDIPTLVRCLKGDRFGNHEIRAVLDKGVRSVVRVSLANGKSIVCTPDHELRMFTGEWVPASELRPGDIVTTNGQEVCKECGSSENVITSPNAKFRGYCRVCMYRVHRAKPTWKGGRSLDKDGYVRLSGHRDHPEANQHGQILEHRYVMEKFLGRYLASGELVHHINEIKDDNRIENLEIVSSGDHMRKHDVRLRMDGGGTINGGEVIVLPRGVEVVSVEDAGEDHVYDVVMADPYRNFVADGIVVHNCGKSLQSLVAVAEDDAFPCLIICPASLKLNWKREIGLWIRDGQRGEPNIFVASGTKPKGIPVLGGPIDFFIINYDIVHAWQDIISSYPWKSVICDEVHMAKSSKSRRTQAIVAILKAVNPEYRFMLTGTPILNRPAELWPVLGMIGGQKQFGGWFGFAKKYCGLEHNGFGYKADGATNLAELNIQLRSSGMMIRRRKEDVLTELPDKQWAKVPMAIAPSTMVTAYRNAERDLEKFLNEIAAMNSADPVEVRAEVLQRIAILRQLAWRGKEKGAREWIDNFLETGKKLIVFAWHRDAVLAIADHYNAPVIMGGMKQADVEENKRRFQEDDDCRIIVMNIAAGGVGHTLTAASDVLFLEYAWNYALMDQAISRAHRIGQKDNVTGWMLVAEMPDGGETIDHEMIEMIERKESIVKAAIDGGDQKVARQKVQSKLSAFLQTADEWEDMDDE